MNLLSRAEEIILLAILRLEGDAYGLSIRDFIHSATRVEWSLAQIYEPLDRLTRKGFVRKFQGAPTPERGGRHKWLYTVTPEGKDALAELRRIQLHLYESPSAVPDDPRGDSTAFNPRIFKNFSDNDIFPDTRFQ